MKGLDTVLLEQELDALGVLVYHAVLEGSGTLQVQSCLARVDPVVAGASSLVQQARGLQERLGGNATPVEARPPEMGVLFHHPDPQAQLRGTNRGHIAARATTNDHQIQ